jgi:hypothetical protein
MAQEEKRERSSSSGSQTEFAHQERPSTAGHHGYSDGAKERLGASQRLANPLAGLSPERLGAMGEDYARLAGLTSEEDMRAFRLGAMIAGDQNQYDSIPDLTAREREVLVRETTHKWSNPSMLYWVIVSTWTTLAPQP